MDILESVKAMKNLTYSEEIFVSYFLNSTDKFLKQNVTEIAAEIFISAATIYRLLDKLGYNGLAQFKIDLVSNIKKKSENVNLIDINYPIKKTDSYREVTDNLIELYCQTANDTKTLINYNNLIKATEIISDSKIINIFTTSSNINFAENFKFQMKEIGYTVNVPKDDYNQNLYAANCKEKHAAIIISYGGRSKNLHRVAHILKENKVKTVLITSTQENEIEKIVHLPIYLASVENHYHKVSSFSSRFSLLFILDILYSAIFNMNYDNNIDYKIINYKKINKSFK
ncbi:MurR/RpiR family transcriptional regulator [Erysipelothrix anatis]|uniref:MurR/RpiR family transcriptional regulator n=1 Tax=Erysipelothrix anatis TaxID=2683713 RepID=UPI00140B4B05|nr:MurR/RpiR family transcriptional regulator [Erysipelothrix anatis]